MKQKLSNLIRVVISPAFIILLIISASLWFLSRLSHTYTSTIELNVTLRNDYNSTVWVDDTPLVVKAMVQGDGRDLLLAKLGSGYTISVPLSSLTMTQDSDAAPYMFRINEASMLRALTAEQNEFTINMIMDTIAQVKVSEISEITLPVVPDFDIEYAKQHTQMGDIILTPDSITIKAPLSSIDTLKAIHTEHLQLYNLSNNAKGTINLMAPPYALISSSMVRYNINVVGYTEIALQRPIKSSSNSIVVPSSVDLLIKIPFALSSDDFNEITIALSDSYVDRDSLTKAVEVRNLPAEVIGYSVVPEYVQCYNIVE